MTRKARAVTQNARAMTQEGACDRYGGWHDMTLARSN